MREIIQVTCFGALIFLLAVLIIIVTTGELDSASRPQVVIQVMAPEASGMEVPTNAPVAVQMAEHSPAVRDYAAAILVPVIDAARAAGEFDQLLLRPRYNDDQWRISLGIQMAIIWRSHEQAIAIVPPAEMSDIHSIAVDGFGNCQKATDLVIIGIPYRDAELINQARKALNECTARNNFVEREMQSLQAFVGEHQ